MARKTPAQIKANFVTGAKPTQAQFEEFIDNSVPTCARYKALLNQTGENAPVGSELRNTIGVISYNRGDSGFYKAISDNKFKAGKTSCNIYGGNINPAQLFIYRMSDSEIGIDVVVDGSPSDGYLSETTIEIEVYD